MPKPPGDFPNSQHFSSLRVNDVDPKALDTFGALDLSLDLNGDFPACIVRKGSDRPVAPSACRDGADVWLAPYELDAGLDPLCSLIVEVGDEKRQSTLIVFGVPIRAHCDFCRAEPVEIDRCADEDGRGIVDIGGGWFPPEICIGTGFDGDGGKIHVVGRLTL